MPRTSLLIAASLALVSVATPVLATDYVQAAGSTLTFASSYEGDVFTGRFPAFITRFSFDPTQLAAAKLDVTIPLAGTTTANAERDDTLKGSDFFNVGKFPQARYTASKFRALGGNKFAADGLLSLHGVSKPVTLNFTWTAGAQPVLTGKAIVKRMDFGVGGGDWTDTSLIPNDVAVSTKVVFTPAK